MFFCFLFGLIVAIVEFCFMEFVIIKRFRTYTLSCLLVGIGGGLLLGLFFGTPLSTHYQIGWISGVCLCLSVGFARGARKSR